MKHFFQTVSRQMAEEIKAISEEISHSGIKGDTGEEIVRSFLKKYLPKKYSLTKGCIVDFTGSTSKQVDIIIYDALQTIPFYSDEKTSIIPVENVYATVEVKTVINKTKLIESLEVFQSVFDLLTPFEYSILRNEVIIKDVSLIDHFKRHPKNFIIGLNHHKSSGIKTLMNNYLKYVREKNIKFPLTSFCGTLNDNFFVDVLKEELADHAENPSEVYLNFSEKTENNTLLFFLLNLVRNMEINSVSRQPDYMLYLNVYNKRTARIRLADGWMLH